MNLTCDISGVTYRLTTNYSIKDQVGQASTAQLHVGIESNPLPVSQQLVTLKDESDTTLYTGIIQSVDTPEFSTQYETYIAVLNVKSLEVIFDNRIVIDAIQDKFAHEIIEYIFDEYLAEEGLTKGLIETTDRHYNDYVANGLTIRRVFDEICDGIGFAVKVDENKVFTFQSTATFTVVEPPEKLTKLKQSDNSRTLRTVQRLTGANEETTLLNESVIWGTDQATFTVGYQISSVFGLTINGNPVNVGILGVDDGTASISFLTQYGSQTLTINSGATVTPVSGDIVAVAYYGYYAIEIVNSNLSLIEELSELNGTSGKIENLLIDTSIATYEDGQEEVDALLSQYGNREYTINIETKTNELESTRLLNMWQLDYSGLGIVDDFVIVERDIKDHYDYYNIKLKLKNRNFYAKYGTVLNKNDKQLNNLSVRSDSKVIKTATVSEPFIISDNVVIYRSSTFFYPVSESSNELYAPVTLDNFYPV